MTVNVTPHLNFRGRAREALEFWRDAFGGEIAVVTYGDAHAAQDPGDTDLVMFGQVEGPNGFRIMAYDVQAAKPYDAGVNPVYVSVRGTEPDEVRASWDRLREGAEIETDLGPSAWSPLYGMLRDRFGVVWVIDAIAGS